MQLRLEADLPTADVYRALGTTLQLLGARLDRLLDGDPPGGIEEDLRRIRALTDDVVRRVHDVVETIDDGPGRRLDLVGALRRLGRDFARATGMAVEVQAKGSVDNLADELIEVVFEVACESFLTIERHCRASVVLVVLDVRDASVVFEIRDDGIDLAQREAHERHATRTGLVAVAALIKTVGGRVAVSANAPRGLHLVAEIPRVPMRALLDLR